MSQLVAEDFEGGVWNGRQGTERNYQRDARSPRLIRTTSSLGDLVMPEAGLKKP